MNKRTLIGSTAVLAAVGIGVPAIATMNSNSTPTQQIGLADSSNKSGSPSAMPGMSGSTTGGAGMPSMPSVNSPTGSATGDMSPSMSSMSSAAVLRAMPAGTVTVSRASYGHLTATIDVYGLTPGSSHNTAIDDGYSNAFDHVVRFGSFTADSSGQAHVTLTSVDTVGRLPYGSRFVIRLGTYGGDGNRNAVAEERIAQSDTISTHPNGQKLTFHAVSVTTSGAGLGHLSGRASFAYNPQAQTLTISVYATGLSQGKHAAHVHMGSCQNQGGVVFALPDLVANRHGVVETTSVITGVTSVPPAGSWYLNIHQGDSNQILVNGIPSLSFRPLLCTDIGTVPTTTASAPSDAPSVSMAAPMPGMGSGS